ncbi:hypothetical protein [Hydrogenophaga sp.]|uniref:hypothetical protein n=1 Tax=Hydrogenophaga sp. TaxID=1904254 RepID=UPI003F724856
MTFAVALLGGDASSTAALAAALRRALALQAPDAQVLMHESPALASSARHDLTLLLAPDPVQGLHGEAADALLREALHSAGTAFQIVHGQGAAGLQQALRAIGSATGRSLVADDPALTVGRGQWRCENCSDPDCEHRLFTGLVSRSG